MLNRAIYNRRAKKVSGKTASRRGDFVPSKLNLKEKVIMAKIEKDDEGDNIINVSNKVGVSGINLTNDVMVVQALLKYLTLSSMKWCRVAVPEPTGFLDKNTQQAIFDYQEYKRTHSSNPKNYRWVAKDGAISSYKKGINLLKKQEWTIISLNMDCGMLSAALMDGKDHVDAICRRWITVATVLGRNPLFL